MRRSPIARSPGHGLDSRSEVGRRFSAAEDKIRIIRVRGRDSWPQPWQQNGVDRRGAESHYSLNTRSQPSVVSVVMITKYGPPTTFCPSESVPSHVC